MPIVRSIPSSWSRCGRVALVLLLAATAVGAQTRPADRPGAEQRIILVTGSTDGLGREVARRAAASGAHVIVHGRNLERGRAVVAEIRAAGGSAAFFQADFASLAAVRAFADTLRSRYSRLDVVVNNAGIWRPRGQRELSRDGHELHFAVNYLAGYLLTNELLPLLTHERGSRIVNVASAAQAPLDFADIMLERGYSGSRAYAQSKLAQVLFTIDLAERLEAANISVVALHPATLMNTSMVEEAGVPARSTVAEGAAAVMQLVDGVGGSGDYFDGRQRARAHAQAYDPDARARLRDLSRRLTDTR